MQSFDSTRHSHLAPIHTLLQCWWDNRPSDVVGLALYGSRAKNCAEHHSDWDIAVLTRSDNPDVHVICRELPRDCENAPIHALCESIDTVRAEAEYGGNVMSAIAHQGIALFGDPIPITEGLDRKPSYIAAATSIVATLEALAAFLLGANVRYSKRKTHNNHATAYSANAAEHLVKGFLSIRGVNYRFIHDIAGLCDQLESERPEDSIVKELRKLDGFTTQAHKGPYQSIRRPLEALTQTTERVCRVLALLPHLVAECFDDGDLDEDVRAEVLDVLAILQERASELQDLSLKQEFQRALEKTDSNLM
ncbi:MAG: HEPN domain-containing protein [Gammaproteobacteria bacterium]|nr:HEPN domain-containing protein [Gammaproteobacteria bacterium]MYF37936.1 HEPN domain-containing protein [Gammaproteobacteria bacterium]